MTFTILVTGGAGFIGRPLVARLVEDGHSVHVFDSLVHGQRPPVCESFRCLDLRDSGSIEAIERVRPDVIVHLAGMSHMGECESDLPAAFGHNVTASANVIRGSGAATLLLASSAAVYPPAELPHHERSPCLPHSVYGTTKLLTEQLARLRFDHGGAPTWVFRLTNVYGPGDRVDRVMPAILNQLRDGSRVLSLGNVGIPKDFVYVEDVVEVMRRCINGGDAQGWNVFNVGSGVGHSVSQMVEHISRALGEPLQVVVSHTRRRRSNDAPVLVDISRLKSTYPEHGITSVLDGVRRTLIEEGLMPGSIGRPDTGGAGRPT